jgi:16S rRNA (cytidine1402-2'-O)-methyltransferase
MPGTLFVVATPIGNLEDITLRALRVLREVDVIAAEDTRHTAKLLAHFGISTPTTSFHTHNTKARLPQLLQRLGAGESVALVSDAGTPLLSDPGAELIEACIRRNVLIDPLPGANAPLTAAIASGFPLIPLMVLGFPPTRAKDRITWFEELSEIAGTVTFFEAPHRIVKTLQEASDRLGNRPIMLARELTKVHQEFLRGTARDIIGQMTAVKGECTVVIGPRLPAQIDVPVPSDADIRAEFGRLTELGALSRRDAIAALAKKLGQPSRAVYAAVERAKKSGV